ncbi:VWA domain-containing protein [Clostridium sp. YIM B02505]|uniref:VWA domain-containing protein n=1 Tax=Clostridium yunnanense TaxID=2800325 RepID=A0ABS1ESK7_9CLOT|nr:vWA domain-containing protein [Clostridium yunnanense]MBK1812315.1 VWA domain-containing protein [Clostridium yunnanense]
MRKNSDRKTKLHIVAITVVFILSIFNFGVIKEVKKVKAAEQNQEKNLIILIDKSLSMKKTDPFGLSLVAGVMLMDTLSDKVNVNVLGFGETVTYDKKLSEKPSRESLKTFFQSIKFEDRGTDLKEGLKEAISQLDGVTGDKSIIILSDGKEDPVNGLNANHESELNSLVKKAYSLKIKINTIGLSKDVDQNRLNSIAFNTDGDFLYCENSAELFNAFSKMLGDMEGFYTIANNNTQSQKSQEIKLSSMIDEVIIKTASCENKSPLVSVTSNGEEVPADKTGDTYKIYRLKNNSDKTLKIDSKDNSKNSVIVQIKSKASININAAQSTLNIPRGIPLKFDITVDSDKKLDGVYLQKKEQDKIENLNNKVGDVFKFEFNKDKPGQYPITLIAQDGNGGIIGVKEVVIHVNDYPPFYYESGLPKNVKLGDKLKLKLVPKDGTKVVSLGGTVVIDDGKEKKEYPLKLENGALLSEIELDKKGIVKISTSINGVVNNESFSYYLPYESINVIDKPAIDIEGLNSSKKNYKFGEIVNLNIKLANIILYDKQKVEILDEDKNKVGEFEVDPKGPKEISVSIKPIKNSRNLKLSFKTADDVKVTESISTKIVILSGALYYLNLFKIPLIIIVALALIALFLYLLGKSSFKKNIESYSVAKELDCTVGSRTSSINLSMNLLQNTMYLNFNNRLKTIAIDDIDDNAIGYFTLTVEDNLQFLLGLLYLIKKDNIFKFTYCGTEPQEILFNDEEVGSEVAYTPGVEVSLTIKKEKIRVIFM